MREPYITRHMDHHAGRIVFVLSLPMSFQERTDWKGVLALWMFRVVGRALEEEDNE